MRFILKYDDIKRVHQVRRLDGRVLFERSASGCSDYLVVNSLREWARRGRHTVETTDDRYLAFDNSVGVKRGLNKE
jgi:hypothetical protein